MDKPPSERVEGRSKQPLDTLGAENKAGMVFQQKLQMIVDVVPEAQIPCMHGMFPRNILIGHLLFFWTPIGKPFMYLSLNHGKWLILPVVLLQAEKFGWTLCC